MPIYEYRCQECGKVFSLLFLRSADANGQERCSACGSGQTKRLISTFAIGGRVDPGPGRTAWPTNWEDTNGADPETLHYWRHRIEREARLEEKYPELADPLLRTGKSEIPVWGATVVNHNLDFVLPLLRLASNNFPVSEASGCFF